MLGQLALLDHAPAVAVSGGGVPPLRVERDDVRDLRAPARPLGRLAARLEVLRHELAPALWPCVWINHHVDASTPIRRDDDGEGQTGRERDVVLGQVEDGIVHREQVGEPQPTCCLKPVGVGLVHSL